MRKIAILLLLIPTLLVSCNNQEAETENSLPQLDLCFETIDFDAINANQQIVRAENDVFKLEDAYRDVLFVFDGDTIDAEAKQMKRTVVADESEPFYLKIKLPKNKAWKGMQTFTLYPPNKELYPKKWLFYNWSRQEGVVAPKADLVELNINGTKQLYAYEEHFDKHILELQGRREGVIIRFENDTMWSVLDDSLKLQELANTANVKSYKPGRTKKNPILSACLNDALGIIENNKSYYTDNYIERYTDVIWALSIILDMPQTHQWYNRRYYYNSLKGEIERVAYIGTDKLYNEHVWGVAFYNTLTELLWSYMEVDYRDTIYAITTEFDDKYGCLTFFNGYSLTDWSESRIETAQEKFISMSISSIFKPRLWPEENPLYKDEKGKVVFALGNHSIREDLIFERNESVGHYVTGDTFIIQKGTTFDLTSGSSFLMRNTVIAKGTKDEPITIKSSDGTGCFLVIGIYGQSVFEHVHFENLRANNVNGIYPTGAVNFLYSDVKMSNCSIKNVHSEDAINFFQSNIQVDKLTIGNTMADALDADFCTGTISNCEIYDVTNDALDFSGSTVDISDCNLYSLGDKGVSVGEQSTVTIYNTTISHANIAVTAKDLSNLEISNSTIRKCNLVFQAFQKKAFYGAAHIDVTDCKIIKIEEYSDIRDGSTLVH